MTIQNVSSNSVQPSVAAPERPERSNEAKLAAKPPLTAPPAPEPAAKSASPSVEEVARRLESYMKSVSRALEFRVDEGSGRTVISVRDADTGELIRQIPSDEVLQFAQMTEDQTVVLLDEKV